MADRTLTDGNIVEWDFGTPGQAVATITDSDDEGTSGQILTSNGAGNRPTWEDPADSGGGACDFQRFNASGTWNKPTGDAFGANSRVLIEAWGGGGSGARSTGSSNGGGGGGGYVRRWMLLSELGSTETVTIGAGGAQVASNGPGNDGNATTFGAHLTAYGGRAGETGRGGGGAGPLGAGSTLGVPGGPLVVSNVSGPIYHGQGGNNSGGEDGIDHGGGGGSGPNAGGDSVNGGGGGGGNNGTTAGAGGSSVHGGDGGAAGVNGASGTGGTQPAGGGGGAEGTSSAVSGAGGDGRVDITVFPVPD